MCCYLNVHFQGQRVKAAPARRTYSLLECIFTIRLTKGFFFLSFFLGELRAAELTTLLCIATDDTVRSAVFSLLSSA